MTLLRAMDPRFSEDADILRAFYPAEKLKLQTVVASKKSKGESR